MTMDMRVRRRKSCAAPLLRLTKYGLKPVTLEQAEHFRLIREFCANPAAFVEMMMAE
jgi:predicted ATPase